MNANSIPKIKLKRAYEKVEKQDGLRILVERLWPRGVSKEAAAIDLWLKDVAPSKELRQWFNHEVDKWPEFRTRYHAELNVKGDLLLLLRHRCTEGTVTFVYAASDEEHNSALVLKESIERMK